MADTIREMIGFVMRNATVSVSPEEPRKTYVDAAGLRYVFFDGVYDGFYDPNLKTVI